MLVTITVAGLFAAAAVTTHLGAGALAAPALLRAQEIGRAHV